MSPPKEICLPHGQTSCKILGLLWSKLRNNQSTQMDRQGSSAEQSDNIELSQLKQCQQALELLFLLWLYFLPSIEAWKASTLHLFWGQKVLGQLVQAWTGVGRTFHSIGRMPQLSFLVLSCILERTSPLQSGGGCGFGSHISTSFIPEGNTSVM